MELQHHTPCSYLDLMPDLSSSLPPSLPGPLTHVVDGTETACHCFLFNSLTALGERLTDLHLRILESGMVPLCGAQLHKSVDIEGQPISADLQSGRCVAWAMMVPLSYVWLLRCVMFYCRVPWPWAMLTWLYVWLFRCMICCCRVAWAMMLLSYVWLFQCITPHAHAHSGVK